jgi:hypothetical protein
MHRKALCFPLHKFTYVGVGDPPDLARNQHFEASRRVVFERDPLGQSEESASKKRERNFSRHQHGHYMSCPELASLLVRRAVANLPTMLPWCV